MNAATSRARKITLVVAAVALLLGSARPALAQGAPDSHSVLILASSVRGGASSLEARQAAALGLTADLATDEQWAAKTASDFGTYRAIVLGDRNCEGVKLLAAAEANKDVWAPALNGSIIVVGTHPAFNGHPVPGAVALANRALNFATSAAGTGAYITLGCFYDVSPPGTEVGLLQPLGSFRVVGQEGCSGDAHLVARDPALGDLTDDQLSNWRPGKGQCDTDTGFVSWPSSFTPLAIARDVVSSFVAPDGTKGSPFILARGESLTVAGAPSFDAPLTDASSAPSVAPLRTSDVPPATSSALGMMTSSAVTASTTLSFDGTRSVQGFGVNVICDDCAPDAFFGGDNVGLGARVNLDVSATWDPTATVDLQYSASLLRQGETLDLVDTLTGGSGPLTITYTVSGDFGIYFNPTFPSDASIHNGDTSTFSFSLTGSGTCTLKLDGDGVYACSATKVLPIFKGDLFGLASIDISVPVTTTLTITPQGVVTVRSVSYSGTVATGPNTLTFHGPSPSVLADNLSVACTAPVGAEALYKLDATHSDPSVSASTSVGVKIEVTLIITVGGTVNIGTIGPGPTVTMNLTAPSQEIDLGPILPDNKPPLIGALGPYFGVEGTAIAFSAAATTDNCAATLSYVWHYSDGGIAFGQAPFHAFADNGTQSGELVVTDQAGNSATKDFSAFVANAAPVVHAGPDTGSPWGVPVAFNGNAADPGSADQATLSYVWSFGDGSPSASGGPSVTHAYSAPGTYTAIFTACDKDGACSSDTRSIAVRKRALTVGYLGDHSGVFDTASTLNASLVDELGQVVANRAVQFAIGSEAAGSSSTDSSGVAAVSHVVGLDAGSYMATAAFAGDALYTGGGGSGAYSVSRKGTTLTYTGALSGGPNKTVTLSAVLRDASGTPLAGRDVDFQVGAQAASATTDASGVATTSLKLNQKNGSYPLIATFTPSGADANRYLASGASATFSIGGKP